MAQENQNQQAGQTATVENNVNNNAGAQQAPQQEATTAQAPQPAPEQQQAQAPQQKPGFGKRVSKAWDETCKFVQENPAGAVAIAAGGAAAGVGLCKALAAIGRWWRN